MSSPHAITYDLYSLPTAQHRAGLAGLVILAQWLGGRRAPHVPEITHDGKGLVRVMLTQESLTALLDSLYDVQLEERQEKKLRKVRQTDEVKEPIRVETRLEPDPRTKVLREQTYYIYRDPVPAGAFLQDLGMPQPWLKLWREVIWSGIRAIPKTRTPYNERAAGRHVRDADRTWKELHQPDRIVEVSGSAYLGAQEHTADNVPFLGQAQENLLLHFWQVVMGVGEARRVELDAGRVRETPDGFVIIIPDVADLDAFVDVFKGTLAELGTQMAGYRPRDAILSLPAEGGLEYLRHLSSLAMARGLRG